MPIVDDLKEAAATQGYGAPATWAAVAGKACERHGCRAKEAGGGGPGSLRPRDWVPTAASSFDGYFARRQDCESPSRECGPHASAGAGKMRAIDFEGTSAPPARGRTSRFILTFALAVSGCGDVRLVDPDAELKSRLMVVRAVAYSLEGDARSYLRVEVSSRSGLDGARLFAIEDESVFELPLGGQVRAPCGADSTCFELILGPDILLETKQIRMEVPGLALVREGLLRHRALGAYQVDAAAQVGNDHLEIQLVADPIGQELSGEGIVEGRAPFERRFEVSVEPGPCDGRAAGAWIPLRTLPDAVPVTFDDTQLACLSLRPVRPQEGPPVASRTVMARAVVRAFRHVYTPPSTPSPLAFSVLFDLQIPSPSRCRLTQDTFIETVQRAALRISDEDRRGAPVVRLPSVQIARSEGEPCRQLADRRIDAVSVANELITSLHREIGIQEPARILLIYATNLNLPLPRGLLDDIEQLAHLVAPSFIVSIGPEGVINSLASEASIPWVSTFEPAFEDAIAGLLGQAWPFVSVTHSLGTVIPLGDEATIQNLQGWRLCAPLPNVSPVGTLLNAETYAPTGPGPAYTVELPEQRLVASRIYRPPTVEVRWEGCFGLCERPGPGQPEDSSWLEQNTCTLP